MAQSTSDQTQHDALLTEGRTALLAGDKLRAQHLLREAVRLEPESEEAWIWLSGTYAAPADMAVCLRNVLAINPANEQALEGLRWLESEYGVDIGLPPSPPTIKEETPAPLPEPVNLHPPRTTSRSGYLLLEVALHPFAVGVLLGLIRLLGWLRPETLALLGGDARPLGYVGALNVALTAALLHGLALLLVWLASGLQVSRVRGEGRGDLFDSLVRVGQVWIPGYIWAVSLVAVGLGLRAGAGMWRALAVMCWAALLLGAGLIVRRLLRLLDQVSVPYHKRSVVAGRLLLIIGVGGVLGLGLAGIATAALLR